MAAIGKYYHLQFRQADRDLNNDVVYNDVHIRIYDLSLEGDDTVTWNVEELTGSGQPFRTATVDNSEDKFTGIKPTQATVKFLSSSSVNMATFADSNIDTAAGGIDPGDPRWYVEAYLNNYDPQNFIFKGFLVLDDCREAFMPEKNEVVLVANDGLGFLKDIPLVKPDATNPTGYNRIADYLSWGLKKTGLKLNLNVVFNIREASLGSNHLFDVIFAHAKTFEDKIGTSINCFDEIERILGEEAFLCQRAGEWWIMRVDEVGNNHGYYTAVFDSDGVLQSISGETFIRKVIEKDTAGIFFSQEATDVTLVRPHKYIKETFQFDYPQEILDNIDFSRGITTIDSPIAVNDEDYDPDFDPDTINQPYGFLQKYVVDDWTIGRYAVNNSSSIASTTVSPYIVKIFSDSNLTYERLRYVVVPFTNEGFFTDSLPSTYLRSNPVYVESQDKATVSVDFKFNKTTVGNNVNVFGVILQGDSGKYYVYGSTGIWVDTAVYGSTLSQLYQYFAQPYNYTDNSQKIRWSSLSIDLPPMPESGELFVYLSAGYNHGGAGNPDAHYTNLRFTYAPFINGSYSKYSSRYYKISKSINYVNKREEQVYISDGLKKIFKGGLFKFDNWITFLISQSAITTTIFGTNLRIVISATIGDVRGLFPVGSKIKISGTVNNNGIYTVASLNYNAGNTVVEIVETLVTEGGLPTITFQKPSYALTNQFYSWTDVHTSTPDPVYVHPYAHIQAFDVWNQHRNTVRKFHANCQGLGWGMMDQTGTRLGYPSLIQQYLLQDSNENTDDRIFMLLSFDIDWFTCEWTGTLIEVYNSAVGKHYDDQLEIKFLQ